MKLRKRFVALALLLCAPLYAEVRSLTILHTNDLHARLSPLDNGRGGFAWFASAVRKERANCTDCLFLFAGDLVQGSPVSTIFHGIPVFEIGNLLGFDVATLGNHEFDYGWPQTKNFISIAKYPIVTSNVVDAGGRLMTEKPYVIVKVNGLRVAVIGVMSDDLASVVTPKAMQDWHSIPAIETARKYAKEVRAQSDLIVLLAHIAPAEERAFLEQAPEIPVIVSGHAHGGLPEAISENGHIAVRCKAYGEELGRLELKVDTEKKAPVEWHWKRIVIDHANYQPAPDVQALVKHWEDEVSARVDQPIAVTARAFTKREVKGIIEQALRDETGADFAWMNAGGVRDPLPKGQILARNIWDIMPFDNTVVTGTFKGSELPKVVVGDRKIDPNKEYTLAVSDFTAANQQTSENLQTTGLKFPHDVGLMRDILLDWFRKKKVIE